MRIMGSCCFAAEEDDVRSATTALQAAGYALDFMDGKLVDEPDCTFVEACKDVVITDELADDPILCTLQGAATMEPCERAKYAAALKVMDEIKAIIDPFGGDCGEAGEIGSDHIAFGGEKLARH